MDMLHASCLPCPPKTACNEMRARWIVVHVPRVIVAWRYEHTNAISSLLRYLSCLFSIWFSGGKLLGHDHNRR